MALALRVALPFSLGYFLSYYFRTVNAVLSQRLVDAFDLTAAQLGTMTAMYFLLAAMTQLPFGWALDRFGPRKVQSTSLLAAALGATLFALAGNFSTLIFARSLIGIGVASALLAGMKAIAMAAPRNQLGLLNGIYISIGAAGAIAASAPTELLLQYVDWRRLFLILAMAALVVGALIANVAPGHAAPAAQSAGPNAPLIGYPEIFRSRDFWQIAPLSATAIGGAWALQGLWSAPWLRDVARLEQAVVAQHLLLMAIALSITALGFGLLVHVLGKRGIQPGRMMIVATLVFLAAECALAFSLPIPPWLPWCVVGAFASATVFVYTITAQCFPKESLGRANSALTLLHFSAAFVVQTGFGKILSLWSRDAAGHYPTEAYRCALLVIVIAQALALAWFIASNVREQWRRAAEAR